MFDLPKAFDTVSKEFLLKKIFSSGIRGTMLKLIDSYMSERNMYVKYKNSVS